MTTIFSLFFFIQLSLSNKKQCKLEDGSLHDCPIFDIEIPNSKLFTEEELKEYNGKDNKKIYLVCLGEVFDVTKGEKYYGPNAGHYNGFVGKDGSRAFAVGGFTSKELIPLVSDLEPGEVLGIFNWCEFYRKDYIPIGKLIGYYYDINGNPTNNRKEIENILLKAYYINKQTKDMSEKYPRCNSQSGMKVRDKVWCSNQSGGVKRDWVGTPRLFLDPTLGKIGQTRCACVPLIEANDLTKFKPYDGCGEHDIECFLEPPIKDEV